MGVFDERITRRTHFGTRASATTMQNPMTGPKQVQITGRKRRSAAQGQPLYQHYRQARPADLPLCLGQVVLAAAELK